MTAPAGAALNAKLAWQSINWKVIESSVSRLQARIVKAVQQGRWNKAKALQHLLTRSASAKLLAVRRVTENDGRKTPGVDNVLWESPRRKLEEARALLVRGYRPLPLRRFEANFKDFSYGFRPRKNAHQALREVYKWLNFGCQWVVDADIKSYFDRIPHDCQRRTDLSLNLRLQMSLV